MMTQAQFEAMLDGESYSDAAMSAAKPAAPKRESKAEYVARTQQAEVVELIAELIELLDKGMPNEATEVMRTYFAGIDDRAFEAAARTQIGDAVLAYYTKTPAKAAAPVTTPVAAQAKPETAFVDIEDSDVIARLMRGQLVAGKRKAFILAGNAIFTVRSKATQTRFTYKVVESDPSKCRPGQMPVYFVSLLNGADNTGDFAYIGTIFPDGFRTTRKSRVAADAPSAIAFAWLMKHVDDSRVEIWHEGRCGRCGRTLTVPESIESGLGPICAGKA